MGKRYRVEYTEDLGANPVWQTLQEVTLSFSPYLLIDPASPGRGKRFCRSVPLP